ncbi:hypothetical protein [Microbacterium sp. Marseille-Q6648]|uniref:hypothetical protein n=1 Tax=Microbacterium sp. Marseille-Q6648 TaxID=2937991 RepID=UPI00203A67F9|nr:hypothetical protein [Microbacterium sp. Marseille-Q6648]
MSIVSALTWAAPAGSTKMSLCGAAVTRRAADAASVDQVDPDDGVRANGMPEMYVLEESAMRAGYAAVTPHTRGSG